MLAGAEPARRPRPVVAHAAIADVRARPGGRRFDAILADPPWRFLNRTGKMAPGQRRLARRATLSTAEICALPVDEVAGEPSHLYLWTPNALLPDAQYALIEACSPGPALELFARGAPPGWTRWGDQAHDAYAPDWPTYAHTSTMKAAEQ